MSLTLCAQTSELMRPSGLPMSLEWPRRDSARPRRLRPAGSVEANADACLPRSGIDPIREGWRLLAPEFGTPGPKRKGGRAALRVGGSCRCGRRRRPRRPCRRCQRCQPGRRLRSDCRRASWAPPACGRVSEEGFATSRSLGAGSLPHCSLNLLVEPRLRQILDPNAQNLHPEIGRSSAEWTDHWSRPSLEHPRKHLRPLLDETR